MKDNYIHVCFVIDESGSMSSSIGDVIGGFKQVIEEQKAEQNGSCSISLYKFNNYVTEVYRGKDISEVEPLVEGTRTNFFSFYNTVQPSDDNNEGNPKKENEYCPGGGTAMFDGIGQAVDTIGKWLSDMPEEERPAKNLFVIMTDGEENSSREYSATKVKNMIKHQEDVYNWSFIYMGTDITTTAYADSIGISQQVYTTRDDLHCNYSIINNATKCFRSAVADTAIATMDCCLSAEIDNANDVYYKKTGKLFGKKSK